jgi:hypothetical protein
MLAIEYQTGFFAIDKMCDYEVSNPNSTHYQVYRDSYKTCK